MFLLDFGAYFMTEIPFLASLYDRTLGLFKREHKLISKYDLLLEKLYRLEEPSLNKSIFDYMSQNDIGKDIDCNRLCVSIMDALMLINIHPRQYKIKDPRWMITRYKEALDTACKLFRFITEPNSNDELIDMIDSITQSYVEFNRSLSKSDTDQNHTYRDYCIAIKGIADVRTKIDDLYLRLDITRFMTQRRTIIDDKDIFKVFTIDITRKVKIQWTKKYTHYVVPQSTNQEILTLYGVECNLEFRNIDDYCANSIITNEFKDRMLPVISVEDVVVLIEQMSYIVSAFYKLKYHKSSLRNTHREIIKHLWILLNEYQKFLNNEYSYKYSINHIYESKIYDIITYCKYYINVYSALHNCLYDLGYKVPLNAMRYFDHVFMRDPSK